MGRDNDRPTLRRHLSLPSSPLHLVSLRAELRCLLRSLTIPETVVHDVVAAAHEAAVNAMFHGNGRDEANRVQVEIAAWPGRIEVQVTDEGSGFGWREWLRRSREEPTPPGEVSGRGILVMAGLMDEVAYSEAGNVVCLTKRLGA